jgi:hypothetical protein
MTGIAEDRVSYPEFYKLPGRFVIPLQEWRIWQRQPGY